MYSSVNNHDKSKSILAFHELLGIIAVFSFVLYLLFPKGNIEDFLDTQENNTNLSINYLQSMLLYHPDNLDLKMMLMEKYTQVGQEKKALEINVKLIKNTKNKKFLNQLYKVEYLLYKSLYFKNQTPEKLQALKKRLLSYYEFSQGMRDYLFFFGESTNIDYLYLKYHSLKNFMKENPEIVDYELEKMAFDLASTLNYEEEAYTYLQKLIKYPEINDELKEYLVYSLFERNEFTKAKEITTKFFLESQSDDEITKFFHLALYALVQDKNKTATEVSQLIQNYANLKTLQPTDITIILNTLLELGESKEAANFSINMFYFNPETFTETSIDLALTSLLYHSELEQARIISFFAESKFNKQKYLDKTILISTWLSDNEAVIALNKEGYHKYKSKIYETYFLNHENLDDNYEILGEIYKKKIRHKNYVYLDNLAKYYDYTGEINQAEEYFTTLFNKTHHKKAHYYAIDFSYKNSHFKKGLKLYKHYISNYGKDAKLQETSIKKLLALKKFKEAYAMSQQLNTLKKKQRFNDLAWQEKDYASLYTRLWQNEKKNLLNPQNFEELILLEKQLNKGKKLNYLYQQAWEKTKKPYYLSLFLYDLLEKKAFKKFSKALNTLNKKEKQILNQDSEFQVLLANHYATTNKISLALKSYENIFKLNPKNSIHHQSYLWFLLDNKVKYPELIQKIRQELAYLKEHPTLRNEMGMVSIVAAMSTKKHELAEYWLQQLQYSPKNKEYKRLANEIKRIKKEKLYSQYDKMLNEEYLDTQINFKRKSLGKLLKVEETNFTKQWNLYQNLKSKISLNHYRYRATNKKATIQNAFDISLKNSKKKFLWDFHLGLLHARKDFISSSLSLNYTMHNFQINVESKYQNKTQLTPKLEQNALENTLALTLQANINRRTSVSLLSKNSTFEHIEGKNLGSVKQLQFNANHTLHLGYPDITLNAYVSDNQFSKNIAQDFLELGIGASIGRTRQNTLNNSWKPFGSFALAINEQQHLGGSLSLGISKTVNAEDSLDLLFDYYNGIGVISEPIYSLNLKYRF